MRQRLSGPGLWGLICACLRRLKRVPGEREEPALGSFLAPGTPRYSWYGASVGSFGSFDWEAASACVVLTPPLKICGASASHCLLLILSPFVCEMTGL